MMKRTVDGCATEKAENVEWLDNSPSASHNIQIQYIVLYKVLYKWRYHEKEIHISDPLFSISSVNGGSPRLSVHINQLDWLQLHAVEGPYITLIE